MQKKYQGFWILDIIGLPIHNNNNDVQNMIGDWGLHYNFISIKIINMESTSVFTLSAYTTVRIAFLLV